MMKLNLFFILASVWIVSATTKIPIRIVHGDTDITVYPFMVNMQYLKFSTFWLQLCSGVLVTRKAVLSVASCFFKRNNPSKWLAVLGSSRQSGTGGIKHDFLKVIVHPNYNSDTMTANIAILRLRIPAVYNQKVQPVRIAGDNYNIPDNGIVTAVGWKTLHPRASKTQQLQHVDVNIVNNEVCSAQYKNIKKQPHCANYWPEITPQMMCTGIIDSNNKGPCSFDHGGPLVHRGDILVGLLIWNFDCSYNVYPSAYTRVSYYTDWIFSNGWS